ncbi:MAG: NAD(P)H-hydrate epimerase [Solirubrobacterales bacterium]
MQHGAALARESGDAALAEAVVSGNLDGLDERLIALIGYAVKLTRSPAWMVEADLAPLRDAGLDDRAIVDANQVVAYYNYVNRVADGLGVELEATWPAGAHARRGYDAAVAADELPWLTVDQMRELDRIAVEELGLTLARMMENAGRHLAALAVVLLGGRAAERSVVVLAGPGGNGGGGLVATRHLAAAEAQVSVLLSSPPGRLAPVTGVQHEILTQIGVPTAVGGAPGAADLVIDALLGYSQAGPPAGEAGRLIDTCAGLRTLALDVPSGLELATGVLHQPHVRAEATLTLAGPKTALRAPDTAGAAGQLFLADISIPLIAYQRVGVSWRTPFGAAALLRMDC